MPKTIGENIRAARMRAGFRGKGGQRAFAAHLDMPQPRVSELETGRYGEPELSTLLMIAKALRTSIDTFLDEVDPEYDAARAAQAEGAGIKTARDRASQHQEGALGATTAARVLTANDEETIEKLSEAAERLMDVGANIVEGIAALTGQAPTARSPATKYVSRARRRRRSTAS